MFIISVSDHQTFIRNDCYIKFIHIFSAVIIIAIIISLSFTLSTVENDLSNENNSIDADQLSLNSTEIFTLLTTLPWPIQGRNMIR